MDKKIIIGIVAVVVIVLILGFVFMGNDSAEGQVPAQTAQQEQSPVLDTDEQVFSEFDSALSGLE